MKRRRSQKRRHEVIRGKSRGLGDRGNRLCKGPEAQARLVAGAVSKVEGSRRLIRGTIRETWAQAALSGIVASSHM